MPNAEKKAYLSRYRLAGLKVQRLTEEITRWESRASALTAKYVEPSGTGRGDPLQQAVEKMLELWDQLARQLEEQLALRREIEGVIGRVEDGRLRELLRLRYLEGWTWEKVALSMECSKQWIHKLHYDAIVKINAENASLNNKNE